MSSSKPMNQRSRCRKAVTATSPSRASAATEERGQHIRVCVIGAGVCGLAAIKAAKENGFAVDAFETSDGIGGLWRYDEKRHGVAAFTHINVSKQNYCFSDFPFDDSVPDYPHHTQMLQYLEAYAARFDLLPHIHFNCTVERVSLADGGGISVTVASCALPHQPLVRHYDYIMIASGHHVSPLTPEFPGLSLFQGQAVHSISCAHCSISPSLPSSNMLPFSYTAQIQETSGLRRQARRRRWHRQQRRGHSDFPRWNCCCCQPELAKVLFFYFPHFRCAAVDAQTLGDCTL
jgi:hypothetical protein